MNRDYSRRYGPSWGHTTCLAKESTGGLCCFPSCTRKADVTHHSHYRRRVRIADCEIIGYDCFPLCHYHHSRSHADGAHHIRNYLVLGVFESRNTFEYWLKLRIGFLEKLQSKYKTAQYIDYISWVDNG